MVFFIHFSVRKIGEYLLPNIFACVDYKRIKLKHSRSCPRHRIICIYVWILVVLGMFGHYEYVQLHMMVKCDDIYNFGYNFYLKRFSLCVAACDLISKVFNGCKGYVLERASL